MPAWRGSPDNPVVLGVRPDPEPVDAFFDVDPQRSVVFSDADGAKIAEVFEVQGRVTRIRLEERKVFVS
jgi:hypothetical protein